jgi:beta-lactamase class A
MDYSNPTIATREAEALRDTATKRLGTTVRLMVGSNVVELPAATVINWLESVEQEGILALRVQLERAATPLNDLLANKVAVAPGTVTITTHDFVEVSRSGGGEGRQLDVAATATNIAAYAMGATEAIEVVTMSVEPRPQYIRSYSASDVGMSALMKNYAEEHPGVYGVSLIELSGQRRRASYEETRQFATASTYKLFVAYSVLRRVETGELQWNEQISGGRTLTKCFDDMIVLSDNPCAEALVKRIGYRPLTAEATALGATRTTFVDAESYKTTAGDLSLFLAQLETGQLPITSEHRTRLIDAMKRNVYRRGIPAGATGVVADKVGFLGSVLHDGAIVYAPSGTYVLSVMTDGSSWGNIAELTREIEKLRTR